MVKSAGSFKGVVVPGRQCNGREPTPFVSKDLRYTGNRPRGWWHALPTRAKRKQFVGVY
jgi:hypothetical protein